LDGARDVPHDGGRRLSIFETGQVSGKGLFATIRDHYPRWVLYATLVGVMLGNTIEAAADLGGMAAALNLLVPIPIPRIVVRRRAYSSPCKFGGPISSSATSSDGLRSPY
jgi:Natural resistance-associated macrophage protein